MSPARTTPRAQGLKKPLFLLLQPFCFVAAAADCLLLLLLLLAAAESESTFASSHNRAADSNMVFVARETIVDPLSGLTANWDHVMEEQQPWGDRPKNGLSDVGGDL